MLLSLFRLTMVVSLLISAVNIQANSEKFSYEPVEKSALQTPLNVNGYLKEDSIDDQDEDTSVVKRESRSDEDSNEDDFQVHQNGVASVESRVARADGGLANKMAKDVLKSPKTQETLKKLTRVGSSKGKASGVVKVPAQGGRQRKSQRDQGRRKGRRNRKRKRHHRKYRAQHPQHPKRGSSKRTSESRRDTNAKKLNEKESSVIKHNQPVEKVYPRSSIKKPNEKKITVKVASSDYVDFTAPQSTKCSVIFKGKRKRKGSMNFHDGESMIERLMRTTTKDPLKKNPGDQGLEYSDYYSDDDVLQDIAANKIPISLAELKNSNDRVARQIFNSTSFYDKDDRHSQFNYQDYESKDAGYRDGFVNLFNNFQNYPTVDRSGVSRERYQGVEESLSHVPGYKSLDSRIENSDDAYPVGAGEYSVPDQPLALDQATLPDFQVDLGVPDPNGAVQSVPGELQNSMQLNYLNQYENPQEEKYSNFDASEAQDLSLNKYVEPQMQVSQNDNPELSQFPNKFVPDVSRMNDFEGSLINTQMQVSQNDNPELSQFPNKFVPDVSRMNDFEGSLINTPSTPSQLNVSPVQSYNNDYNKQGDQGLSNFPVQIKNNPSVAVSNAMDQPLGKVLESLGIDLNHGSTLSSNIDENTMERDNNLASPPESYNREHVLSPSYLKKKPEEEDRDEANLKESKHKLVKGGQENGNLKESQRRHSSDWSDNYLSPLKNETKMSSHNVNISVAVHDTKEVANQILDTIMEELEDIKQNHGKADKTEGSWSTAQAGMKLDMRVVNHSIIVTISEPSSPQFHESLLNGTWNISGHAPFKRGSPFTLTATNNSTKSLAVFVGACRVCQGVDTIAGIWSVARNPKDCRDFQVATSVFNDIFRKTKWSSLREKQNTTVSANATESSTLKNEKRKS